jgi:hypothetical protein
VDEERNGSRRVSSTSVPPRTNRERWRLAPGLAWSLWGLAILLAATAVALRAANHGVRSELLPGLLLVPGFGTVGAVVASRRPTHPIGWLFLAVGLVSAVAVVSVEYAVYTIVTAPGSLPGGVWVTWLADWTWPVDLAAISFLVLLVPTGRLPSPRWRPIGWLLGAVWGLAILGNMFTGDANMKGIGVANPIGLVLPFWLFLVSSVLAAVAVPAVALAPFLRLRRATGVERQQLKWLALVVTVTALLGLLGFQTLGVGPVFPSPLAEAALILAVAGVTIGVPVTVGLAILRHRLYDIDHIINRTLVYGLLTALLGVVYAGVVLVLGQLFGGIGVEPPSWAVAGATLTAAALFQPARRRIQQTVDRRFNRRKYNTAKTIEAFSTRLRDQIDLDTLSTELLAVVDQTMEPTRVSLWLRPSAHGLSGTPHSKPRPTPWAY